MYYQWEDKNRLRKLWDALTDDNGQVSMQAVVLEKIIFTVSQKTRGKEVVQHVKPTQLDMFKMRCFASIHRSFFSIDREVNFFFTHQSTEQ